VQITDRAKARLRVLKDDPSAAGKDPRLFIDSKVCDGFRFEVAFDEPIDGDACIVEDDVLVLVYEPTLRLIEGAILDYDSDSQAFTVDNPRANQFRGKFFRKSRWRERVFGRAEAGEPQA